MLRAPLTAVSLALLASLGATNTALAAAPAGPEYCRVVSTSGLGASVEISSIPLPMTKRSCLAKGGTVTTTAPDIGMAVPGEIVSPPDLSVLSTFHAGPTALTGFTASLGRTAKALFAM
ncbi:hypothetical protein ACIREE_26515 [Streptomyces sp. NPDC102467]|uniref:hypothetical protein n=1 Tax=Streptomyces sp. NPDC102467 TaxID=3366179 RepID=UPI003822DE0D